MKKFTPKNWTDSLMKQNWETIGETEDVDQMVEDLTKYMTIALDEVAPMTNFKIRPGYKQGLTDQTKNLIGEREEARKNIKRARTPMERIANQKKYKLLRNKVISQSRADTIEQNGKMIDEAKNESDIWKIVNDINSPKAEKVWKLKKDIQ